MNKLFYILFLAFCINVSESKSQAIIDTVISFKAGKGQNLGQGTAFFPKNIFTLPPVIASKEAPASIEEDVLSLGFGGEIIVSFKDLFIVDGEGPDFSIFENVFLNPATKKMFVEPGIVSVSQDGLNFYTFPFDSLSLVGCAGLEYTNGGSDYFNPNVSGGDKFDLKDIGLSYIKYIKIKDFAEYVYKNPKHLFYDPILSGFDLDAVVGLNVSNVADVQNTNEDFVEFDIKNMLLTTKSLNSEISIFNQIGQLMIKDKIENEYNLSNLENGFYLIQIKFENKINQIKFYKSN